MQDHEITILETSHPSQASHILATRLAFDLENASVRTRRLKWNTNISGIKAKDCISLLELDTPFLQGLGEDDFEVVKQLILQSSSLLWITALDGPAGGIASGMARSIRNEVPGIKFRTVSVQAASLDSPNQLAPLLGNLALTSTSDDEFLEKDGILEIGRVVEDPSMNREMSRWFAKGKNKIESAPLEQTDGPQKLNIRVQGMLDTMCLETDEDAIKGLGNDEVEIEVKATGLK